jgi:hypothetical protein
LQKHPNRFNALYGAASAADKAGNNDKATGYYKQLISIAGNNSVRPEIAAGKQYLQRIRVQ